MDFCISGLGLNHYKVSKAFMRRYFRENTKTIYKILLLSNLQLSSSHWRQNNFVLQLLPARPRAHNTVEWMPATAM